jgi:hypothetical protein
LKPACSMAREKAPVNRFSGESLGEMATMGLCKR